MKHVAAIKDMLVEGELHGAHDALEDLLALGPNNVEALSYKLPFMRTKANFKKKRKNMAENI